MVTTDPPVLRQPFTVTCSVAVPDSLDASVEIMIISPAGRLLALQRGEAAAEAIALLPRLQETNLGQYRCRFSVFSNEFSTPVVAEESSFVHSEPSYTIFVTPT